MDKQAMAGAAKAKKEAGTGVPFTSDISIDEGKLTITVQGGKTFSGSFVDGPKGPNNPPTASFNQQGCDGLADSLDGVYNYASVFGQNQPDNSSMWSFFDGDDPPYAAFIYAVNFGPTDQPASGWTWTGSWS